ncbi:MAG: DUF2807 domain-containing protein [Rikenellaceae bacterium]|nr:DUF2807 domain-containing protein [Rikenellaceae bacterium]MCL2693277.1 DUF2807 domain-containing protein [Rikenellaceae bacterium]
MKRILFLLALLFVAANVISAQAQSIEHTEALGEFTAVSLSGNINVELIAADENSIEVHLHDSDAQRFRWHIASDGTLSVALRPTVGRSVHADVRIYYRAPLREIRVNGARLTAEQSRLAQLFSLTLRGGANAIIDMNADDIELSVTGNSALVASGETKYLTLRATERSRVDSRRLTARAVEAEAATGAEVYLHASERLVVNARNTSTIYYAGRPSILKDRRSRARIGLGLYEIGVTEN